MRYGEVFAELSPGFFFGENALLASDTPSPCTCIAGGFGPVELWQFSKADFTFAMGQMEHLIAAYVRRQRDGESAEALGFAKHVNAFSTYLAAIRSETDPESAKLPRTFLPAFLFRVAVDCHVQVVAHAFLQLN